MYYMLANQSICVIPTWIILCMGFPFAEIRAIGDKACLWGWGDHGFGFKG